MSSSKAGWSPPKIGSPALLAARDGKICKSGSSRCRRAGLPYRSDAWKVRQKRGHHPGAVLLPSLLSEFDFSAVLSSFLERIAGSPS